VGDTFCEAVQDSLVSKLNAIVAVGKAHFAASTVSDITQISGMISKAMSDEKKAFNANDIIKLFQNAGDSFNFPAQNVGSQEQGSP
jgi:hypothetical protein